jgi:ribosomal protein L17
MAEVLTFIGLVGAKVIDGGIAKPMNGPPAAYVVGQKALETTKTLDGVEALIRRGELEEAGEHSAAAILDGRTFLSTARSSSRRVRTVVQKLLTDIAARFAKRNSSIKSLWRTSTTQAKAGSPLPFLNLPITAFAGKQRD